MSNPYKNATIPNKLENDPEARGIRMYIHGKSYPDPVFYGERKPNYLHKVVFENVGPRNNPYALVDENLRQLREHVLNDVKPFYDEHGKPNLDKKDPQEFNTYIMKQMLFVPSNGPQPNANNNNKALGSRGGRSKKSNRKTKKGGHVPKQEKPTLRDIVEGLIIQQPEYVQPINNNDPFITRTPPTTAEVEQLSNTFDDIEMNGQLIRRQREEQRLNQRRMEGINNAFRGIEDFHDINEYKNYWEGEDIFKVRIDDENIQHDTIVTINNENIQNDLAKFKKGLKYLHKILNSDDITNDADTKTTEFRKFRVFHNNLNDDDLKKLIHDILKEYVIKTTQNLPIPINDVMRENLITNGTLFVTTNGGGRKSKKNRMSKHKKSKIGNEQKKTKRLKKRKNKRKTLRK
jgi:hypothetical protein